jgi:seipin
MDGPVEPQPGLIPRLRNLVLSAVQPLLDFISSPTFLRVSISAVLFFIVSSLLFAISTTAFLVFYWNYIPPISLSIPLYFQYGVHAAGNVPYAIADVPSGTLISQQPYAVTVDLSIPRTPTNLDGGVFMVDVRLLGAFSALAQPPETLKQLLGNMTSLGGEGHTVLQHSRRPSMLRYRSRSLSFARDAVFAPLYLLGFKDLDSDNVKVKLWEAAVFSRGSSNVPTALRVEIAASGASTGTADAGALVSVGGVTVPASIDAPLARRQVQIYSASITFAAQFSGLRYVIYHYRVLSFILFSLAFYSTSIISMGLVWALYGSSIMSGSEDLLIKHENQGLLGTKIKTEDDQDVQSDSGAAVAGPSGIKTDASEDWPAQFAGNGRGRSATRDEGGRAEDGGAGAQAEELAQGETADDEDDDDIGPEVGRGTSRDRGQATSSGRFSDSGIGTMSESARASGSGLVRRRSGRR